MIAATGPTGTAAVADPTGPDAPGAPDRGDAFAALLALVGAVLPPPVATPVPPVGTTTPSAPAAPSAPIPTSTPTSTPTSLTSPPPPLDASSPPVPAPMPNPGAEPVGSDGWNPPVRDRSVVPLTEQVVEVTQPGRLSEPNAPSGPTPGANPGVAPVGSDGSRPPVAPGSVGEPTSGVGLASRSARRDAPVGPTRVPPDPAADANPGAEPVGSDGLRPPVRAGERLGEGRRPSAEGRGEPAPAGIDPAGMRAGAALGPSDAIASAPPVAPAVPVQLVEHVQALDLHEDGDHELTIALEPVELGRIELKVRVIDGVVHVHVDAGRVATADLVRQAAPDLRGAIEAAGLALGSFVAASSPGQDRAGSGGGAGPGPGERHGRSTRARGDRRVGDGAPDHPISSVDLGPGRVDLTL